MKTAFVRSIALKDYERLVEQKVHIRFTLTGRCDICKKCSYRLRDLIRMFKAHKACQECYSAHS